MRSSQKKLLLWALLILGVIAIYNMFAPSPRERAGYVPLGELMTAVHHDSARIKSLHIYGRSWEGEWSDGTRFQTRAPELDGALIEQLDGVPFDASEPERDDWLTLIVGSWLPMLVIVGGIYLALRKLQGTAKLQMRVAELEAELQRLKEG